MAININYFLESKCNEIFVKDDIYIDELYDFVADDRIKFIFSALHQEFNRLINFMYSKRNKYFNAEESRELINDIEIYNDVKTVLERNGICIELDNEYEAFLNDCTHFLKSSGGSTIPDDIKKIKIKKYEPIFNFSDNINIKHSENEYIYPLKMIGEGSYATVYKYFDEFYNMNVVIKRAKSNLNVKEIERFKNEYNIMSKLNSPYILKVYRFNHDKNEYYAEYADMTIRDYILTKQNNNISIKDRFDIINQLLDGFKYISINKILHRDICINNILIKLYDDKPIIKIADFGLVKEEDSMLTSTESEIKGSFNDISNLTLVGFSNYNIYHETYALSRLIVFILTGKTKITDIKDNYIKSFIKKGIHSNPKDRYSSIDEIKKAVDELYSKLTK